MILNMSRILRIARGFSHPLFPLYAHYQIKANIPEKTPKSNILSFSCNHQGINTLTININMEREARHVVGKTVHITYKNLACVKAK